MASTSRWRQQADEVIARVLETMPGDANLKQKKDAIDAAYPFGQRKYLPYRHWCKARKAALALGTVPKDLTAPLPFRPAPDLPRGYLPFLKAIAAKPWDNAPRLIFADFLGEEGDTREQYIRDPDADAFGRAMRMLSHILGHLSAAKRGSLLADYMDGTPMLVRMAEIDYGVAVARSLCVLDIWRKRSARPAQLEEQPHA